MVKNMGSADKVIRLIVSLFIISLVFWGPQTYWGLLGIIPLITVFTGFCPLYRPFRISTRKTRSAS